MVGLNFEVDGNNTRYLRICKRLESMITTSPGRSAACILLLQLLHGFAAFVKESFKAFRNSKIRIKSTGYIIIGLEIPVLWSRDPRVNGLRNPQRV